MPLDGPLQRWRRSPYRFAEPVCPSCTLLGFMLCVRCLRWFCTRHYAAHDNCRRVEMPSYIPIEGE